MKADIQQEFTDTVKQINLGQDEIENMTKKTAERIKQMKIKRANSNANSA